MNSNTILPSDDTTKAFCLTCAYPLNPLDRPKGQCPECGRSFDLGDPATFSPAPNHLRLRRLRQQMYCRLGLLYDAYRRAATKPTRWLWPAALVVYATAAVASMLLLGDLLWPIFYLCAGLCVIGLAFTPCRIVRRDLRALGKFPADAVITDRAVFRRIGNASVWLTLILLLRLPFYLFFLINLPALNNFAHRIQRSPGAPTVHHIGLVPVRRQLIGHGGAEFEIVGRRSLLYRPAWESDYYDIHIRHVIGAWFVCDLPIQSRFSFGEEQRIKFW